MSLTIRPITVDEVVPFRHSIARGFGADLDELDPANFLRNVDPARTVAAFDGDDIVGTLVTASFDLALPGGTSLPMGGTTMVTVQPTHRRQGVLGSMMRAHLDDVRAREEPLAALWASETAIYGRFGFGIAAELADTRIDARTIRHIGDPPPGRTRLLTTEDARRLLPPVYDRVRPTIPGMLSRTEAWWETRYFHDPDHRRQGRSAARFVVHESNGGVDGYAIYRQKEKWDDFPEGEVNIIEVMPEALDAHAGLWRLLTSIDLFPNVRYVNAPSDDILPWRVNDSRRVVRCVSDSLWVRLLDIPRALAGRRYAAEGSLVLGVRDPFLPENDGRYALTGSPTHAECNRTDAAADLTLDVDTLAAPYLGGPRFNRLARAGLVEGREDAIRLADRMFAGSRAPWCPEVF